MSLKAPILFIALLLLMLTTGVAAADEPISDRCLTGDPFELAKLADAIEDDSPPTGPQTINRHIIVERVGKGSMTDSPSEMAQGPTARGNPNPTEPPADQTPLDNVPLRIFNTRTQFDFRVTFSDELLKTINECHERNGRTAPGGPATPGAVEGQLFQFLPLAVRAGTGAAPTGVTGPVQPAGWSNGTDTRILRTPTTLWPWRTITNSSSGPTDTEPNCTLTLIGPRHLVTAAHCLVNFGTSAWKTRMLTPGRDGMNVSPYGSSWMDPTPPPGVSAWYIVPDPWLDPNTDSTGAEEFQWDIGAVLMLDRLGDQTGWMGYGAFPASDLNNRNQLNRGYPECDKIEAPIPCQSHRLYGDTQYCDVGYYHHQGSNGWNREYSITCDMGRGHSGSPLYHYRYVPSWQANGPYVAAVISWHECFSGLASDPNACTASDDDPNHVRRITPWVRDWISWLREQFP
jgi:V8-like Glu-specific endopeptidase